MSALSRVRSGGACSSEGQSHGMGWEVFLEEASLGLKLKDGLGGGGTLRMLGFSSRRPTWDGAAHMR